jgi:hypothetical protein
MAMSDSATAGTASTGGVTSLSEDRALRRERRIAEFQTNIRPRIAAFTAASPLLEDLADSFPGLLFAMASNYNDGVVRERAIAMTLAGSSLRQIGDALALPLWLRRLPPAAYTELFARLPLDAEFGVKLGSFIPTDRRRASAWLTAVSDAFLVGGRDFALWTARAFGTLSSSVPPSRAGLVSAWYWYSFSPGTHGFDLLRGGFDPRASTSHAAEEFNTWLKRVALVEWLGTGALEPWIPDAQLGGFQFAMLRRAEDFIAAAAELDNCLEQFAPRLANGVSTVAKITRGGRIVACIEIGLHETDPAIPAIIQLRGHKNKRVPAEIWRKAYDWMSQAPIEPFQPDRLTPSPADRHLARQRLWEPYLLALEGHHDPAGKVAAQRLRRNLMPRFRTPSTSRRLTPPTIDAICRPIEDRQPTMLQRVREHLASLAGFSHTDNELTRWDSIERLEIALRRRGLR